MMKLERILNHSIKKAGLSEEWEYNIYGLVLVHWNVDTNLQVDLNVDYHELLRDVPSFISGIVMENIRELNAYFLELTRLYKKLSVIFYSTAFYHKLTISCYN